MSSDPYTDLARQRLKDLRDGLLKLHKTLLDSERVAYEAAYGKIASTGEMFQLVVGHEWFAWLHKISELIVQIDEMLDAKEATATQDDATRMIDNAKTLLQPSEEGSDFAKRYYGALQRDADNVIAHGRMKELLRKSVFHLN